MKALPTPAQELDHVEHSVWGVNRINKYDISTTKINDLRISIHNTNFPCKNLDNSGGISNPDPSRYHTTEVHPTQDLTLVAGTKVEDNEDWTPPAHATKTTPDIKASKLTGSGTPPTILDLSTPDMAPSGTRPAS